MKKTVIFILITFVLIAGLFWLWGKGSGEDITNFNSKGKNIIAYGDSLTAGVGASKGKDYVSLLQSKAGVPVINAGKSGDTTESALMRINEVLNKNPRIVIIFIGGNDYLRKLPIEETFSNIEEMIKKIQEKGSAVVLVGVPGGILGDPYQARFEGLAEKYKTAYVPQFLKSIITKQDLMSDSIHPNNKGYAIVAENIYEVLKGFKK